KGSKDVQPLARQVYQSVSRPDWIGVRDEAGVLSAWAQAHINSQLEELSRTYHVAVVAETVASLPEPDRKKLDAYAGPARKTARGEMARRRSKEVGAERAMFLYICMDPPAVQVAVAPEVRHKTARFWKPEVVSERLNRSLEKRDLDRGLEEVVQMLRSAMEK